MSFVSSILALNTSTSLRGDSGYRVQRTNQAMLGLMNNADSFTPSGLLQAEKQLTFTSLQNQLMYKINTMLEENYKKQTKKNIERDFSTFA